MISHNRMQKNKTFSQTTAPKNVNMNLYAKLSGQLIFSHTL